VGLLDDWEKSATIGFKAAGETLILLGHSSGHVGQSLWQDVCHGGRAGDAPVVDLDVENRLGALIRRLIADDAVTAVHDISDGGALVAVAEMGLAGGNGVVLTLPAVPNPAAIMFGEDQGRALVTTRNAQAVIAAATAVDIFAAPIGTVGGEAIAGPGFSVTLADLRAAHEGFFPKLMGADAALA
jgi:phosphoribosylformylglycinamidine synthase